MMTKERTKGPACIHCSKEMKPHPVKMFGFSWRCSGCGCAYRIDYSEKDLYNKMVAEGTVWEENK